MGRVSPREEEWLGTDTIFEEDEDAATATTVATTDGSEPPADNDSALEDDEDFEASFEQIKDRLLHANVSLHAKHRDLRATHQ